MSVASWLFGLALLLFIAELIWRRIPRRSLSSVSAAFLASALLFSGNTANAQSGISEDLVARTNALIEASMRNGVKQDDLTELFQQAVLSDGNAKPVLDWLTESRGEMTEPRGQVIAELEVHIASRRGDLERASGVLGRLLAVKELAKRRPDLRIWHAKLHDALGNVTEAKSIYEELTEAELSPEEQQQREAK